MSEAEIAEAAAYLRTGGLGETYGMAMVAAQFGSPKVQMDTAMALALCRLAQDGISSPVIFGPNAQAVLVEPIAAKIAVNTKDA